MLRLLPVRFTYDGAGTAARPDSSISTHKLFLQKSAAVFSRVAIPTFSLAKSTLQVVDPDAKQQLCHRIAGQINDVLSDDWKLHVHFHCKYC